MTFTVTTATIRTANLSDIFEALYMVGFDALDGKKCEDVVRFLRPGMRTIATKKFRKDRDEGACDALEAGMNELILACQSNPDGKVMVNGPY